MNLGGFQIRKFVNALTFLVLGHKFQTVRFSEYVFFYFQFLSSQLSSVGENK